MPRTRFAYRLLLGLLLPACGENMELYRLDQLTTLSATPHGSRQLQIQYRPKSESLYFSPGIALSEHADHIEIRFVRCKIREKCPVTHSAQAAEDGVMAVTIPRPSMSVLATDGKQIRELFVGS